MKASESGGQTFHFTRFKIQLPTLFIENRKSQNHTDASKFK